jgi:hypothetical protein
VPVFPPGIAPGQHGQSAALCWDREARTAVATDRALLRKVPVAAPTPPALIAVSSTHTVTADARPGIPTSRRSRLKVGSWRFS